ncbi:Cysteine-rich, acidic integral membrane protein [Mizuhopecten yessoensis]|uniref:Cysteine-rich, acidic integral membrane protein n=1 Tax=Mizuhopecten yessoensis TaxID=6573 RepID=A0A210PWN4_MIZYE|nr:Cysteine-rich, acidic integral membrane protein [Mizuhopecten yessoensis]
MWKTVVSDKSKATLMAQKSTKPKPKKAYNATMRRLSQFDGPNVSNTARLSLAEDLIPKVVDMSLLVGPVYDSTRSRQGVIKEQLGDITQRLHKTLHQYDVMDEVERSPPRLEILENLTRNIDNIDREELKGHLEGFMTGYRDLTSNFEESNKEREELLMQVADWMTTDHTDLDDLKMSFDENEASEINSEYINTVADLEKLKSLKEEIGKCDFNGKNTKFLEQEKKRLEKSVMGGLAEMKQRSGESKPNEDAHWKHSAGEVVQLLNKVRLENSDEKEALAKKLTELLTHRDRQQIQMKSLQSEVKREKNVAAHLADDNADLTKELMQLRAKLVKYEKDLEHAKKVIERQLSDLSTFDDDSDDSSTSVDKSASEILQETESYTLRETSSDPDILRSSLRELKENVEALTKELRKAAERMKEVELMNMELEDKVEELENRPPEIITETTTIFQEVIVTKAPSNCECHLPKVEKKPSVNLELVAAKEEIEKLTEKNQFYKKALYDTEIKLSDAYKEIAELRVLVDKIESSVVEKQSPVQPPPSPELVEEEEEVVEEEVEVAVPEDVPAEAPKTVVQMKKGSIEEPPKVKPKQAPPKPKPVRKHVARKPPTKKSTLPPIRQKNPPPPMPDLDEIARSEREQVLWTVGELQSMMNGIVQDILEFSTSVGNMIYKEKEGDQIQQPTLKTFDFGQNPIAGKGKGKQPITDRKELEAKDKKSQVFFLGQKAVGVIREIYDILSKSLDLLHEEFEMIYRSFKEIQQGKALQKALLSGQLPDHIKLPGHEKAGGPGNASMKFHGATMESVLNYYVQAYGQLKKTPEKKRGGGYVVSETTEHRAKSVSVTSVTGDMSVKIAKKECRVKVIKLAGYRWKWEAGRKVRQLSQLNITKKTASLDAREVSSANGECTNKLYCNITQETASLDAREVSSANVECTNKLYCNTTQKTASLDAREVSSANVECPNKLYCNITQKAASLDAREVSSANVEECINKLYCNTTQKTASLDAREVSSANVECPNKLYCNITQKTDSLDAREVSSANGECTNKLYCNITQKTASLDARDVSSANVECTHKLYCNITQKTASLYAREVSSANVECTIKLYCNITQKTSSLDAREVSSANVEGANKLYCNITQKTDSLDAREVSSANGEGTNKLYCNITQKAASLDAREVFSANVECTNKLYCNITQKTDSLDAREVSSANGECTNKLYCNITQKTASLDARDVSSANVECTHKLYCNITQKTDSLDAREVSSANGECTNKLYCNTTQKTASLDAREVSSANVECANKLYCNITQKTASLDAREFSSANVECANKLYCNIPQKTASLDAREGSSANGECTNKLYCNITQKTASLDAREVSSANVECTNKLYCNITQKTASLDAREVSSANVECTNKLYCNITQKTASLDAREGSSANIKEVKKSEILFTCKHDSGNVNTPVYQQKRYTEILANVYRRMD